MDVNGDTLELLSSSPTKSFLLFSPVQPQLVGVGRQTLRNPEEKIICSIKGKYSSIRHGRTPDSNSEGPKPFSLTLELVLA